MPKSIMDDHDAEEIPVVVIEVDVKVDTNEEDALQYVNRKVETLLAHEVERVIWIFSNPNRILFAEQGKPWQMVGWDTEPVLIGTTVFNLKRLYDQANGAIPGRTLIVGESLICPKPTKVFPARERRRPPKVLKLQRRITSYRRRTPSLCLCE